MSEAHNALFSTALLSSYRLRSKVLLWSQSIWYLALLSPSCLLFPQHCCLFQRPLPSRDVPQVGQLLSCRLASGLIYSGAHLFVFLGVQVVLQDHSLNESIFFCQLSPLLNSHIYT